MSSQAERCGEDQDNGSCEGSLEEALEGGQGDQAKYLGYLGRFQEITGGVDPHSSATDQLSLVRYFAFLSSRSGYIGVTILPSGLEKGVTLTLFAIGSPPTHHLNLSGSETNLAFRHVPNVMEPTLCAGSYTSHKSHAYIVC